MGVEKLLPFMAGFAFKTQGRSNPFEANYSHRAGGRNGPFFPSGVLGATRFNGDPLVMSK